MNILSEGWTFVIKKVEVQASGGLVHGWFMYFKLSQDSSGTENLFTHYLTPYDAPTVLRIPRFLFDDVTNGDNVVDLEIGPKDIYDGLLRLFNVKYGKIPTPRIEIPLHTVPPSKRDALIEAARPWTNK